MLNEKQRFEKANRHFFDAINLNTTRNDLESKIIDNISSQSQYIN
jgi:hypothetical protein